MMDILLKHICLMQPDWSALPDAYLGIRGSVIDYIGTQPPTADYAYCRDLHGAIVLPGLVNAHCHSGMTLLRGLGTGLPLQSWLFDTVFPVEDRWTPELIQAGSALAILEMLSSGTTSFTDMYFFPRAVAPLVAQSGMKANLCRSIQSFDPEDTPEKNREIWDSLDFFQNWNQQADGRIRADFSIHAEYTCQSRIVRFYSQLCREQGGRMHLHLAETLQEQQACVRRYGCTPTAWFASLGTFDVPTSAAHCVAVTPEDQAILREKGVVPVHNPSSNMKLGSGFAPVPALLESGLPVALGTDGAASNNSLNLLKEIHLCSLIHCGYQQDSTVLLPRQVLTMATRNGALAQGRTDTGVLEVGKKADLIAVAVDCPHMTPLLDPAAALCYSAQGSDVILTMADGKILYDNGEFLTMDKDRIYYEVRQALRVLYP